MRFCVPVLTKNKHTVRMASGSGNLSPVAYNCITVRTSKYVCMILSIYLCSLLTVMNNKSAIHDNLKV